MKAIGLFAGAGGFSTGAAMAGTQVVWAANHWPVAVQYHAANHPAADHLCQDLHQADWSRVPATDLMLAGNQGRRITKRFTVHGLRAYYTTQHKEKYGSLPELHANSATTARVYDRSIVVKQSSLK